MKTSYGNMRRRMVPVAAALFFILLVDSLFAWRVLHLLRIEANARLESLRQCQEQEIIADVRGRVETLCLMLRYLANNSASVEEAQRSAIRIASDVRFGEGNYVWIHRLDLSNLDGSFILAHPAEEMRNRDPRGTFDLGSIQDIYMNGEILHKTDPRVQSVKIFDPAPLFNQLALTNGSGLVTYYWPKTEHGRMGLVAYRKVAYIKYIPDWKWVVGAGAYADHIDLSVKQKARELETEQKAFMWKVFCALLICTAFIVGIVVYFGWRFARRQISELEVEIAERTRVEKALRHNEEQLRRIADNLPGIIYQFYARPTGEQGFYYVSDHAEQILGIPIQPLVTLLSRFMEHVDPDMRHALIASIAHAVRERTHWGFEGRFIKPSGEDLWLRSRAQPRVLGDEVVFDGILLDITDRKRAEEVVLEERQRLGAVIEGTNIGTWEWNVQTGDIIINDRWARMLGYTAAELTPTNLQTWRNLTHPDDVKTAEGLLKKHFAQEMDYYECELRMKHKNGHWIWVLDRGRVFSWTDKGLPLMMYGTHLEITARKQTEEALSRRVVALTQPLDDHADIALETLFSLDDLQRLQDDFSRATGVASLIIHTDGTPITRPSNFCSLCIDIIRQTPKGLKNCYRSDAIIGRHHPDGPIIQTCSGCGLWDAGASITVGGRHIASWLIGQVRNEEQSEDRMREYARTLGTDEEAFMEAYQKVPVMSRAKFDNIAQALFTLSNQLSTIAYQNIQQARFITERRNQQEELRRKNEELERFTYTVSHDLKSPLITVKGFAGALQQDVAAGNYLRMKDDLQRITDAADKMSALLNGLLNLSRIGRIVSPPTEVNMSQVVTEVLALLAGPIKEKHAEVVVKPDLPVVWGDAQRLREVLQNLVENALKFMEQQPHPKVEIGGFAKESEIGVYVRDNGIGIDPAYQETVFGLFNKLNAHTEGTGIGLALVRRIVEYHHGRIWIESAGTGSGSTFYVILPEPPAKQRRQA